MIDPRFVKKDLESLPRAVWEYFGLNSGTYRQLCLKITDEFYPGIGKQKQADRPKVRLADDTYAKSSPLDGMYVLYNLLPGSAHELALILIKEHYPRLVDQPQKAKQKRGRKSLYLKDEFYGLTLLPLFKWHQDKMSEQEKRYIPEPEVAQRLIIEGIKTRRLTEIEIKSHRETALTRLRNKREGRSDPINIYVDNRKLLRKFWNDINRVTKKHRDINKKAKALVRQVHREKHLLIKQQVKGISDGWKNCGCKPEMNCNGRHNLKRLLLSCYLYDDRFSNYTVVARTTKIIQFLDYHLDNMVKSDIEQFLNSDELKWLLFFCYFRDPRFRIYSVVNKTAKIMQFLNNIIDNMTDKDIKQFLTSDEIYKGYKMLVDKMKFCFDDLEYEAPTRLSNELCG